MTLSTSTIQNAFGIYIYCIVAIKVYGCNSLTGVHSFIQEQIHQKTVYQSSTIRHSCAC